MKFFRTNPTAIVFLFGTVWYSGGSSAEGPTNKGMRCGLISFLQLSDLYQLFDENLFFLLPLHPLAELARSNRCSIAGPSDFGRQKGRRDRPPPPILAE